MPCSTVGLRPVFIAVQDPARLGWKPIVKVEHYTVSPTAILAIQDQKTP